MNTMHTLTSPSERHTVVFEEAGSVVYIRRTDQRTHRVIESEHWRDEAREIYSDLLRQHYR